MDTIATISEDEEEVPLILMPSFPTLKFHPKPLHFMSKPGISRMEYEQKIFSCQIDLREDDTISVVCPNDDQGTPKWFQVKQSVLRRSPTLASFFNSPDYVHGCNMTLELYLDPAVCFEIVKQYLEEGPDVYRSDRLRVRITMRFKIVDRFQVLLRLHLLAQKLALPGLAEMAYTTLVFCEKMMDTQICVMVCSIVFDKDLRFDEDLKDWCMRCVGVHMKELKHSPEWRDLLWKVDNDLPKRWARMLHANSVLMEKADHEIEDLLNEQLMKEAPDATSRNYSSGSRRSSQETIKSKNVRQELDKITEERQQADEEEVEEDDEDCLKNIPSLGFDSSPSTTSTESIRSRPSPTFQPNIEKLERMLGINGITQDKPKQHEPWSSLSADREQYPGMESPKAREVMGIPTPPLVGAEESQRKSSMDTPTKSRMRKRLWKVSEYGDV
ncbi:MAG: hypothetical protein Q9190_003985 [Brigantiaea leucoxantha]